jgi:hypothetical protein
MGHFDWPITQKKKQKKTLEAPQNIRFYVRMECLPLYRWEGERSLGNGYEIKWGAIENTLEEHIENLKNIMRNPLRTYGNTWKEKFLPLIPALLPDQEKYDLDRYTKDFS